jgi:hypothetical protein
VQIHIAKLEVRASNLRQMQDELISRTAAPLTAVAAT